VPAGPVVACGAGQRTTAQMACATMYPKYENKTGALGALAFFFCLMFVGAAVELAYLYKLTKGNLAYDDIDEVKPDAQN